MTDVSPLASLSPDAVEMYRDKVKRALKSPTRVEAIRRSRLLEDPNAVPAFGRAVRLAARALRVPVAQLNIVSDRQQVPLAVYTEADEEELWRMPRRAGSSYCKYVVWSKDVFSVDDAREHALVRSSHATRELGIAAYLGAPVHGASSGTEPAPVLGTLCVIDRQPRTWTPSDRETLTDLAAMVSEEIDYRMRTNAHVQASEGQAMRLLESAGAAVLATDAKGVTTYANPTALRLLGYTAEELIGRDQHALIHHSHLDGSRYRESECPNYIARTQGRSAHAINDHFWKSDGTAVTVDSTMAPIYDRGEVIGTVLTFQDVSARHAAEEAEHAARLAAEAANLAKTELLAAMSEELRIPLAAIATHADRLEHTLVDVASPAHRAELRSIQRGQERLAGLVENMAGFATLDVRRVSTE